MRRSAEETVRELKRVRRRMSATKDRLWMQKRACAARLGMSRKGRIDPFAEPSANGRYLRGGPQRRRGRPNRRERAAGGLARNLSARETFRSRSLGPRPASAAAKSN